MTTNSWPTMFKFSLKELLYWLTIWMVGVSLLAAITTAPVALFVVTLWPFGTIILSKLFGPLISLTYSVFLGFVSGVTVMVVTNGLWRLRTPSAYPWVFAVSMIFSLVTGTIVWGVIDAADDLFKRFVRHLS
jgi:hypothetical protein